MKIANIIIWVCTIFVFALFLYVNVTYDCHAEKWRPRMEAVEVALEQTQQAQEYSQSLLSVIQDLAHENTLLCERDTKTLRVVSEFEEENRRLTLALDNSVEHLAAQQTEINDLIDQNYQISYKVDVLERAFSTAEEENILLSQAFVVAMESAARSQEELLKLINENSQLKYEVEELKRSLAVGVKDAEIDVSPLEVAPLEVAPHPPGVDIHESETFLLQ